MFLKGKGKTELSSFSNSSLRSAISKYYEWKLLNKMNAACLTNHMLIYLGFYILGRIMWQRKQLKNNINPEKILQNFVVQACCVSSQVDWTDQCLWFRN